MKIAQKTPRKTRKNVLDPLAADLCDLMYLPRRSRAGRRILRANGDITDPTTTITVTPPVWWFVSDPDNRHQLTAAIRAHLGNDWYPTWPPHGEDIAPVTYHQRRNTIPTLVRRPIDNADTWPTIRIGQTHDGNWVRANLADPLMVIGRSGGGKSKFLEAAATSAAETGANVTFIGMPPGPPKTRFVAKFKDEQVVAAIEREYESMCDAYASLAADLPINPATNLLIIDDLPQLVTMIQDRSKDDDRYHNTLWQLSDLIWQGRAVGHHIAVGALHPTAVHELALAEQLRNCSTLVAVGGWSRATGHLMFGPNPPSIPRRPGRALIRKVDADSPIEAQLIITHNP